MAAHARLSPSSATRWFNCPRSISLTEELVAAGLIDLDKPNIPADEGTAAHSVRADCLTMGLDAWDFVGTSLTIKGNSYPCTDDTARFLQRGIDRIRAQPGNLIVEHRVDLGRWIPEGFGTLDVGIIWLGGRTLTIDDLKFGFVPVRPGRQLRIYALGVIEYYDLWDKIDTIKLVIDQPRNGGTKYQEISLVDLLGFADELVEAVARVNEADADTPLVVTTDGCEWCPVREAPAGCPAYNAHMLDMLGDDVSDLDGQPRMADRVDITPERRWHIAQYASHAKKWLDKVVADSIEAGLLGTPDPGSMVVPGKPGDREYTDEDEAAKLLEASLGADAYVTKLITPAQAEKLLVPTRKNKGDADTWAKLEKVITRPPGKPALTAAGSDKQDLSALAAEINALDDL